MPEVKDGETQNEYLARCIPELINKERKSQEQATAMCINYWKEYVTEQKRTR